MIYLDLETTGLDPENDEILQIGIIDQHGTVLMNQFLKPMKNKKWERAQKVHGITPEMVKDCPNLPAITAKLMMILKGQDVVIYNADYDTGFLPDQVKKVASKFHCAMLAFAPVYGEWNDYHQSYTWQKLERAASYVGHDWRNDKAHDAVSDCKATKSVWEYLIEKGKVS